MLEHASAKHATAVIEAPLRLWALRHGEVRAHGLCYGHHEVESVHPAEVDAEHAAQRSIDVPWAELRIISSPAARCARLASAIAARWNLPPPTLDPRLRELNFGEWEGKSWTEVEHQDPLRFARWMNDWQTEAPPGGETAPALQARLRAALEEHANAEARSSPMLWVTHAGPIRTLRHLTNGISLADAFAQAVAFVTAERVG
jgi:alpha-ribazole phosphatase